MGQILANSEGINVLKVFALVLVFVNWISIAKVDLFVLKISAESRRNADHNHNVLEIWNVRKEHAD